MPLVEVKAQQLEAGLWVGQSASNVRELFQTARDLVSLVSLCIASPNNFQIPGYGVHLQLLAVILKKKKKRVLLKLAADIARIMNKDTSLFARTDKN